MHRLTTLIVAVLAVVLLVGATACEEGNDKAKEQRNRSIQTRADTFARAEAKVPVPHTENFPLRSLLRVMTEREDMVNHPWYTYVLADTGQTLGYYVTKTPPMNKCNFLSSTEEVRYSDYGNMVLTAPSLDGIYYGGGGASGACNQWVMQDYSTGALITLGDVKYFVADRPLNLDAEPIRVEK